jgi:short-subunit dehydrogenase
MQQSKIMTAEDCAARIVRGIGKRERLVIMSARGRVGRWLKLVAPSLIDRIAAKAIRDRH